MRELGEPTAFPLSAAVANQTQEEAAAGMSTHMMMQLRLLNEGVAPAGFAQRFGVSLEEQYGAVIEELVEWGLLVWRTGRLFLTERGRLLGNQVFYRFMLE